MSAQTSPLKKKDAQLFPQVDWEQFETIERSFESIPGVKFVYLDGVLEIMTVSDDHEFIKKTIAMLLEAYLRTMGIRFYGRGGPSLGNKAIGARSEPDESYNLGNRKPYPDIVIEVVVTSGGIDKLEGYRRMQVSEVWFWEDGVFTFYHLQSSNYQKVVQSQLLPNLPSDLFCRYITYYDQFDAVTEFIAALQQRCIEE